MTISGNSYKEIGRAVAGAVSVVVAFDPKGVPVGLKVSSFVTLSFTPPLVMFAIQHDANSYRSLVGSKASGVSLLAANRRTWHTALQVREPIKWRIRLLKSDRSCLFRSLPTLWCKSSGSMTCLPAAHRACS